MIDTGAGDVNERKYTPNYIFASVAGGQLLLI